VPHRSDARSQTEQEERPGHWGSGCWEDRRADGYGVGDGDGGDSHRHGDFVRRHTLADGEKGERIAQKED